jgi:hypothetical protein
LENIAPLGFQNLVVAKVATFTTTEFLIMWLPTLCKNPKILVSMHKCLNNKKTARLAPFTILADLAR